MSDFFDKLKKGMDLENMPEQSFKTQNIESNPKPEPEPELELEPKPIPAPEPEAVLTSAKIKPEKFEKPKRKRKTPKKPKKTEKKKSDKEGEIKIKQGFILSGDNVESKDIFEKEGQLTVDVFETEKDVIIQSAVAGVEPKDLDISIEKDVISIKGKRERHFEEKTENFLYQECYWGSFSREVVLPSEVDKNKAEATIEKGVLTIKIPKT